MSSERYLQHDEHVFREASVGTSHFTNSYDLSVGPYYPANPLAPQTV